MSMRRKIRTDTDSSVGMHGHQSVEQLLSFLIIFLKKQWGTPYLAYVLISSARMQLSTYAGGLLSTTRVVLYESSNIRESCVQPPIRT